MMTSMKNKNAWHQTHYLFGILAKMFNLESKHEGTMRQILNVGHSTKQLVQILEKVNVRDKKKKKKKQNCSR